MTLTVPTSPEVGPIDPTLITSAFRANQDVVPFAYREAETFTALLERLSRWTIFNLIPYLNTNFEDIQGSWVENVTDFVTIINQGLIDQTTEIQTALTAQQADVAANLADTLNQIVSGESAALNDAAVNNALQVANSQALAFLDSRYYSKTEADARFEPKRNAFGFYTLQGPGIDLTGTTVSTAGVQAFVTALPANSQMVNPSGSIILLDNSISFTKKIHLAGDGEYRYVGADGPSIFSITADQSWLDGVYMTNPNAKLVSAVNAACSVFRATSNLIVGFRDGIKIAANGEFHSIIIMGNEILDIIGSGKGPGDSTYQGEDNGDGIVCWGCTVTITGNRVTAKSGSDARIGIHVEALPGTEVDTTYVHKDSMATIGNNVVTGKFRRGIVSEGVAHALIVNNTVADSTMWLIALIGLAHFSTVADNTLKWTRTTADTQFSNGTPIRTPIMLYCIQESLRGVSVRGNTINAVSTSALTNGITLAYDASVAALAATNLKLSDNQIIDSSGTMKDGIHIGGVTQGLELRRNTVPAFTVNGLYAIQASRVAVSENVLVGASNTSPQRGLFLEGGAADARVTDNYVENVWQGFGMQFRSGSIVHTGNTVKTATTGSDFFSSGSAVGVAGGNAYVSVTTKTSNTPAGVVTTGANN
jgi:Right handed beta helix region